MGTQMELSLLPHTTIPPQVLKGSGGGTVATHTSVCPTGALKFSLCDLKPTERCTCMFMEGHQSDPPIPVSPTAVFQRTDAPYRGSPHHLRKPTHEEGATPWTHLDDSHYWREGTEISAPSTDSMVRSRTPMQALLTCFADYLSPSIQGHTFQSALTSFLFRMYAWWVGIVERGESECCITLHKTTEQLSPRD